MTREHYNEKSQDDKLDWLEDAFNQPLTEEDFIEPIFSKERLV